MSYGEAKLDFSSFSVACLSGPNGAGKSAILDAVTWTLWESARSSSEELIRLGQQEIWVDLSFQLEDQLYRVRRSRQRTASARTANRTGTKGALEFQIWNDEKWLSLTAANMRDTQEKINQTLKMDYDTFINSVYLRQGRADEFTTRAPSERKQVLSEILGLDYFDKLQNLARDEARQVRSHVDFLQQSLNGFINLGEHIAESQAQLADLAQSLQQRCDLLEIERGSLGITTANIAELQDLSSRLQPTIARLTELKEDLQALKSNAGKLQKRHDELSTILLSAGALESASLAFKHAREKVEQLDHANHRRQELETRVYEIKSTLATMRGRMEVEVEHLRTQRATLTDTLSRLGKELKTKDKLEAEHAAYKNLIQTEAAFARKQETHVQLTNRAEHLHTLVVEARFHMEAELEHTRRALAELSTLIDSKAGLEAEELELERQAEELDRLEVEFEVVEEQGLKLKQQIDTTHILAEEQIRRLAENESKARELQQTASLTMCPLCAAPIVDRMAVLDRYKNIETSIQSRIGELESEKSMLEDKRGVLRKRYVELRRSLDLRKALDKKIGEFNARKTALERADFNHAKLTAQVAELERRLTAQDYAHVERESLIGVKAELHKLDFDPVIYTSLQSQIRAQRHIEVRHQQLKRDMAELDKLNASLPSINNNIAEISLQLERDDFGGELQDELRELAQKLTQLNYDRNEHQSLRTELARLLPLVERFKELDRARDELPHVSEQLSALEVTIHQKSDLTEKLQASLSDWNERLEKLPHLILQKSELESNIEAAEHERQDLGRQVAVLESKLQQLQDKQSDFASKRTQVDELLTTMNDYEFLAETFGKRGIQAIIIENAVPEIEAEANTILSKLSDNQMHVALITQNRTKQGAIQETLDIVISDDLGTRNYELYSGGEAFKINFAIRVALSRLLARRSGAKLQTLIIDEGFGSQDEISRERLIKAINAIQTDFAKILVVTHIAEIRELFPVQIQVNKDNGVSNLKLLHSY